MNNGWLLNCILNHRLFVTFHRIIASLDTGHVKVLLDDQSSQYSYETDATPTGPCVPSPTAPHCMCYWLLQMIHNKCHISRLNDVSDTSACVTIYISLLTSYKFCWWSFEPMLMFSNNFLLVTITPIKLWHIEARHRVTDKWYHRISDIFDRLFQSRDYLSIIFLIYWWMDFLFLYLIALTGSPQKITFNPCFIFILYQCSLS